MKQLISSSFSSWCLFQNRCFKNNSSRSSDNYDHHHQDEQTDEKKKGNILSENSAKRKPGGWRAISFILGNETFERLASFGLLANFMVYLTTVLHMDQVSASNIMNIWSGVANFAPLVGAFVSDAYAGRFWTIAFSSFASFLGMTTVTLTAWLPQLHPHACTKQEVGLGRCQGPNQTQLGFLLLGLGFLSIGSGGIRPCSIPFGVDQFDPTTDEGRKGINSFFNWYYTTFTIVILITQTIVVYIQDQLSWVVGFGIPTILMACSILFFFIGSRFYNYVKPEGSIFSSIAQVFVAAYKKRHLKLPAADGDNGRNDQVVGNGSQLVFYDPPVKGIVLSKLPPTNQFRYFDKAAVVMENELNQDGTPVNKWRLCSIQQVEELKCIVRIAPIWASGIISLTAMVQQWTFTISQALKMDRHMGPKFEVPAGSIGVISLLSIGLWLPLYDRLLVPALRRVTSHEGGITLLQRVGIGIVFSILAMLAAGFTENARRASALHNSNNNNPGIAAPMSVFWLAPQLILMGFCEAFNILGQIEFFNRQFPEHMRSVGNALFSCSFAGASYLSSLLVMVVHRVTATPDRPDWLTNDINKGRLDYFYYLLAGLGVLNLVYFLYCSNRYRYKGAVVEMDQEDKVPCVDVEMSSVKA
ncbi:Proton-dependent oligopeptide transporter [Parasponia andersonii]|uniref:Proton-dependent oligopeptide transporter n=1 Tax=Parasponia andersonii TaxID=3476 RepID=A0A2P5D2F6_PARAD|nr:Proton-dependent oligopeptide transporter [Parasponia andersonii]